MTLDQLLASLHERGVQLWREGDRLRYRASAEKLTPELLGQLREHKPAILEFLEKAKAPGQQQPLLQATPRKGNLPLSFAQERLWFLDQLEPGSAVYNIPIGLRLTGELKVPVLQRCLCEILRRHEALRTCFEAVEGQPVQVIQSLASLEMSITDLSGLAEPEREAKATRLGIQEAQRPFDLARDLLLRARLVRLAPTEHILVLTLHHIASDGWSVGLLVRELRTLYEAFFDGKPSPLPELTVHYADFAVWQREWLRREVLEKQLGYWREQLEGAPALLELPTDRPRPATQSYRGAWMRWELPKPLLVALEELSRREGATLFMSLLAAFQTLLYRYTGSDDILVGSPIAGRNRTEIEPLIGFFVNTLVLRSDLSGNPSFRALLGRTREAALGAYAHQDLPFERLVEELHPARDMSYSPFFQVMFVLQNAPWEAAQLAGLEVTPMLIDSGTSKFDLTLFVRERGGVLQAAVEYSTDLFEAETIRRMLGHYETLLEGTAANPDQRLSDLPLLTAKERHQLLVEWNQTASDYSRDRCIHELFEAQVERTPEAVAVVYGERGLTYGELNSRANQLAHHLRRLGVGPDLPTAIFMERSVEMVITLLAILKAGGAYVPLDTAYPPERIRLMLEDAEAEVLITDRGLTAELPPHPIHVVRLDEDWETIANEPIENPVNQTNGESLAYVIYTSGSTGKPKGTCIPHRAINRLLSNTNYIKLQPLDRVAQVANASFDAATFEIWGALLNGARLIGILRDVVLSPQAFARTLHEQKITVLFLTTALFNQMAREAPGAFAHLRYLLFGGEAVDPRWVRAVLLAQPPERLLHVYGPTETTTFATWHLVNAVEPDAVTIPIGRPISNTETYILDSYLQPVPIGVRGELHLGGDGLARDYLKRPDLTAEKFIPHPFSHVPGARLYKTGDLCRFLQDGSIEFLGRIDNQVKIRGFRVELEEIQSVLDRHPGVRESVVVMREITPGDKRLVAYLVPQNQWEPVISELRALLKQKLPDYMVPAIFVVLDSLPLSPNGKVDRRALPPPDAARPELEKAFVAPRTSLERVLADIWCDVLRLKQVGVHDNFFDLGGHSLLAIRVQARTESQLARKVPLTAFLHTPTIAEIAALLQDVPATIEGRQGITFASPGPRSQLLCFHFLNVARGLDKHLAPRWPVRLIESPLTEELRVWKEHHQVTISLEALATRCRNAVRQVQPRGPYYLFGYCFAGVLAFEVASQLTHLGESVAFLGLLDAYYGPGSKLLARPWITRWTYHARRISQDGMAYLGPKVRYQFRALKRDLLPHARRLVRAALGEAASQAMLLHSGRFATAMLAGYRGASYPGDAVLFSSARSSPFSPRAEYSQTNGWEAVIRGGVQVEKVDCGHTDIVFEPYLGEVARRLERYLSQTGNAPTIKGNAVPAERGPGFMTGAKDAGPANELKGA